MESYRAGLALAIRAAREAGELLRAELHRPGGPRGGGDKAPADTEAEWLIRKRLCGATPWSFLGEETGRDDRRDADHRWLVDPNDGTVGFLKGARGSAVSIALLRAGEPVLGVVFAFAWPDDEGRLYAWAEGEGPVTVDGAPAPAWAEGGALGPRAIVAVSHGADGKPRANATCTAPARYLAVPSLALRLALAAAGEVVAGCGVHGAGAWDYAAGHALLRGAGGVLVDETGAEIRYAADGTSRVERCLGGAAPAVRELASRPWEAVLKPAPPGPPPRFKLTRVPGGHVADTARLQRAHGCLVGQLAGDALGAQVEFRDPEWLLAHHPDRLRTMNDGGTHDTLAGQPTDDSELALMLARSLAKEGRFDPAAVHAAYTHWFRSSPFDVGNTIGRALGGGAPSRESRANGALMRVSPLGIFTAGRPKTAAGFARADAALTHPHPECVDASGAYTAAIAVAIDGGDARAAYRAALEYAEDPAVRETLVEAEQWPPADYLTHAGLVSVALGNAFFQLLHQPSLEEALADTVMRGGDTDTNAAIAGALLGAVHGREAIPLAWRRAVLTCRPLAEAGARRVRPIEFWPVDALALAETLLARGSGDRRP